MSVLSLICIGIVALLLLSVALFFTVFLLTKIIVGVTELVLEWGYQREKRKRRGE